MPFKILTIVQSITDYSIILMLIMLASSTTVVSAFIAIIGVVLLIIARIILSPWALIKVCKRRY